MVAGGCIQIIIVMQIVHQIKYLGIGINLYLLKHILHVKYFEKKSMLLYFSKNKGGRKDIGQRSHCPSSPRHF